MAVKSEVTEESRQLFALLNMYIVKNFIDG